MREKYKPYLIREVLERFYGIQAPKINLLGLGTININYLVKTKKNNFVLRFYQRNNKESQILPEHKLIDFLTKRGFPTAPIIDTKFNNSLGKIGKNYFSLFKFIEGENLNRPNTYQIKSSAKTLGLYHALVNKIDIGFKKDWWYIDTIPLRRYLKTAERSSAPQTKRFIPALDAQIKKLKLIVNNQDIALLPKIIIHGDFSLRNLKFKGNNLSGVLDFDNCRRELRIFDMVRPLQSLAGVGLEIDRIKIITLFDSYLSGSRMPFSYLEKKWIVEMIRIQHIKEAIWQIKVFGKQKKQINLSLAKKEIRFLNWLEKNNLELRKIIEGYNG